MDFQSIVVAVLFAWTLVQGLCLLGKKLPPGPFPWPVIGNLHLLGNQPHKSLARLAGKYGPVMNLKLGMINTVVISSSAMAKQALQKQDFTFSTRACPDVVRACNHNQVSVVWLPVASKWRVLRKAMNSNIFSGVKLDNNQHLRARKIQELIIYCQNKSHAGEAVDIGRAAFRTTLNLLSNTIFSKDLTDPFSDSAKEFKELVWNIMEEAGKPNLVDYFPFLEQFDPQGSRRRMTGYFTKVLELFEDLIDERLEERKVMGSKNVDVLDSLLNISQERPEEIDRKYILHVCLNPIESYKYYQDMFAAGTDTSSNTLEWIMAELLNNPNAMAKAQAELADVIGKASIPRSEGERKSMDFQSILVAVLLSWALIKVLLCLSAKRRSSKGKNLPPGPFPLPMFGNLHLLGNKPHLSLTRLAQKYGPVMNLKLGMINTVVISSSAMAKQALQKQDLAFSPRSIPDALRANNHYQFSVVWLPVAPKWRALRKILNTNIFSGNRLETNQQLRAKKIQQLIMYCQKNSEGGAAVDIGRAAFRTTLNLLSNTIFSKDLTDPYSDSGKEFKDLVWNIMEEAGKPNLVDYFPFLEKFDPQGIRRHLTCHFTKALDLFQDLIDERLEERKVKGNKNDDALDSLLNISQESPDEIDMTHIRSMFLWELEGGIAPMDLDMEEKFGITLAKACPLRAIPIPI
nr:geraniol 8-hydroxylase-like [Ipomoea batatas]